MGVITQISVQANNKERCNVYIDGEFFCGLSMEIVYKNNFKVNEYVDNEKLRQICIESERADATVKAINYLSKNPKTKRQIKEYLLSKGYSTDTVWEVIDKLKEYNLINDQEYSLRFMESSSKTQGKRLIEYKLMQKGVRKEDIEVAGEQAEISYQENANNLAIKYMKNKERTKENNVKVFKYLIGRGFSYEQADLATKQFKFEEDF